MSEMEKNIELSKVYKKCKNKLLAFEDYIKKDPNILESTIIFVEDSFFGDEVLEILQNNTISYRTYYGNDDASILKDFVKANIGVLVTCNAISQGIDIPSLKNIVIFSSNKSSKGETIQRLGRCLRNPISSIKKIAKVVDFYEVRDDKKEGYDQGRYDWFKDLEKVKFKEDNFNVK